MTAHDLIADIFSRHQHGVPGNERWITTRQRDKLIELIGEDPEGGALSGAPGGNRLWTPSGRSKYLISDHGPTRHKLTEFANLIATESGRLF